MPTGPDRQSDRLDDHITTGSVEGDRHSREDGWATTGLEDPVFTCQAIIRAGHLREEGADPGDAYLEGIASLRARQLLAGVGAAFRSEDLDAELKLLDPPV